MVVSIEWFFGLQVFQYGGEGEGVYEEDEHFASALHDILQTGERLFQPVNDNNVSSTVIT